MLYRNEALREFVSSYSLGAVFEGDGLVLLNCVDTQSNALRLNGDLYIHFRTFCLATLWLHVLATGVRQIMQVLTDAYDGTA